MKAQHVFVICFLDLLAGASLVAQVPALGSIEAPYPELQASVTVAGGSWGAGIVAYGPVGTPLVISGSNFGNTTGSVTFTPYKNGVVDTNASPVNASVSLWTSTLLILSVPAGALTGRVGVTTSGGTSNTLPFIVTPGAYSSSCPAMPDDSQFQIVTSSLQDGTVQQAYSVTLAATGGSQPYTWSLAGGQLPAGLSLSSTGVISGTPTTAEGPVSVTIQAVDNNRLVTQALLNLTIDPTLKSTGPVYSYSANYDGAGNVTGYTDSVMGTWGLSYDSLNRLMSGNATFGDFDGQYFCWSYDNFGNRLQQEISSAAFQSGSGGANSCQAQSTADLTANIATYASNNRITGTNARGVAAMPGYDAAGNMTSDGVNSYLYDAESRICAVQSTIAGVTTMTGYLYDAEGVRIAKGPITTMSCDPAVSGFQTSGPNTTYYLLGSGNEEAATFDGNNTWQRSNVFGAGRQLATYDSKGLHFQLTDPLGTRRVQTSYTGHGETDCENLPFGDQQNCFADPNSPPTADDATPLHFTGKERDTESGNDYFGARYYASTMGRFISPDWSAKAEPVPYAKLENPQSLNLYAYVQNNPMVGRDLDGHICWFGIGNTCVPAQKPPVPPTPDPAHVRPVNDHKVGPATSVQPQQQPKGKPLGLTIGGGISGNADVGVGVTGAEANAGYYKVASVNTKGQLQVSDALSGGTVAYAGSHTAGAPDQSATSPLVSGAYAGVGLSGLIANTSTTGDLSGPFAVTQINIPLVSVQVFNDTSGDWGMSFTIGPSTPTASVFNMTTTTRVDCEVGCN